MRTTRHQVLFLYAHVNMHFVHMASNEKCTGSGKYCQVDDPGVGGGGDFPFSLGLSRDPSSLPATAEQSVLCAYRRYNDLIPEHGGKHMHRCSGALLFILLLFVIHSHTASCPRRDNIFFSSILLFCLVVTYQ